jgi:tocopherol cyclase
MEAIIIVLLLLLDPTIAYFPPSTPIQKRFRNDGSIVLVRQIIPTPTSITVIDDREIKEPSRNTYAYPQQTPHSGRHFQPTHPGQSHTQRRRHRWISRLTPFFQRQRRNRRFTEGWYYRLTLPEHNNTSFAFIISIEDPGHIPPSPLRLVCIQLIGPHDEYIVQGVRNDTLFWAWKYQQGLGCTFAYNPDINEADKDKLPYKTALTREYWNDVVKSGFQVLPHSLIGRIQGRDGTKGGILDIRSNDDDDDDDDVLTCDFDFTIDPICGWGGTTSTEQKSTAGWLSSFPIFEPHWQITLADARATGTVIWKGTTYTFTDAPFYAEKNWGAALPRKWYWTQCNSFEGYEHQLSVVAGGGIRKVPFGKEEALGMVSCHFNGTLYEAVPWLGGMSWEVSTWGSWTLRGKSTSCDNPFEVEVSYKCDPTSTPGLVFRAPTPDEGLVRFCRDTFEAKCTFTLWLLKWDNDAQRFVRCDGPPLIDRATSPRWS